MGLAVALPFGRLIPGGRALRMGLTGMLGFAGSIVGLSLVTMAAFIAPSAATTLFVWSLRRPSAQGKHPSPPLIKYSGG